MGKEGVGEALSRLSGHLGSPPSPSPDTVWACTDPFPSLGLSFFICNKAGWVVKTLLELTFWND